ncbi:MAG: hypothetical protein M0026_02220 [Nocardiopsaceae bacterium]|nr:hypothetical protein [Nocardiopsaceae bacterium]
MPNDGNVRGEHRYEQHINSPDQHEEYPGKSLITRDHDVIRRWAEERRAQPSTVPGSQYDGRPGRLLFDFEGFGGEDLVHIPWEKWFETFDERGLNFIYQEHKKSGQPSNFFRLENPDRGS